MKTDDLLRNGEVDIFPATGTTARTAFRDEGGVRALGLVDMHPAAIEIVILHGRGTSEAGGSFVKDLSVNPDRLLGENTRRRSILSGRFMEGLIVPIR